MEIRPATVFTTFALLSARGESGLTDEWDLADGKEFAAWMIAKARNMLLALKPPSLLVPKIHKQPCRE